MGDQCSQPVRRCVRGLPGRPHSHLRADHLRHRPGGPLFDTMYREADGARDPQSRAGADPTGSDFIKVMATGARSVELEAALSSTRSGGAPGMAAQLTSEEMGRRRRGGRPDGLRGRRPCRGPARLARWRSSSACARSSTACTSISAPICLPRWRAGHRPRADVLELVLGRRSGGPDRRRGARAADLGPTSSTGTPMSNIAQSELTLRAAHAAGTPIASAAMPGQQGRRLDRDFRMIHHGLPARAAFVSATSVAAHAIGLGDLIGTVGTGQAGRPRRRGRRPARQPGAASATREKIWLVIQSGTPIAGRALEVDHRHHSRPARSNGWSGGSPAESAEAPAAGVTLLGAPTAGRPAGRGRCRGAGGEDAAAAEGRRPPSVELQASILAVARTVRTLAVLVRRREGEIGIVTASSSAHPRLRQWRWRSGCHRVHTCRLKRTPKERDGRHPPNR